MKCEIYIKTKHQIHSPPFNYLPQTGFLDFSWWIPKKDSKQQDSSENPAMKHREDHGASFMFWNSVFWRCLQHWFCARNSNLCLNFAGFPELKALLPRSFIKYTLLCSISMTPQKQLVYHLKRSLSYCLPTCVVLLMISQLMGIVIAWSIDISDPTATLLQEALYFHQRPKAETL